MQAGGPQAGGQAIVGIVGLLQRLLGIRYADQVDDRAKHFFPRQVQAVIGIDHQRWGNIEAL
ncbi:hypothetical protein D3C75_1350480 [compost metagenome]